MYQAPTSQQEQEARIPSTETDLARLIQLPLEDELTVDDVKIEPGFMVFEDAFAGKKFVKKLTLRNNGRNSAFVRILPPSSRVSTLF